MTDEPAGAGLPNNVERNRLDKARLPSSRTTAGPEGAPHRSFLYAIGLSSEEIAQPFVGVVTTWNEAARACSARRP